MRSLKFFLIGLSLGVVSCTYDSPTHTSDTSPFCAPLDRGLVNDEWLDEVSGIVASRKNPGMLWVHNDSGHPAALHLLSPQGKRRATYRLKGGINIDWEDIAIGPGPKEGETYLYVGDIGDNMSLRSEYHLYRFVEPTYVASPSVVLDTITEYDQLSFTYPEGPVDAETLLIDPLTQEIYVLTKEMNQVQLYQLRYPDRPPFRQKARRIAALPYAGADWWDRLVGGDISPDGREILLKTYAYVLYWRRDDTHQTLPSLLQQPADTLPYSVEPQGEAIGFAADGSGYYTLSEQNLGADVHLYFYPQCLPDTVESVRPMEHSTPKTTPTFRYF